MPAAAAVQAAVQAVQVLPQAAAAAADMPVVAVGQVQKVPEAAAPAILAEYKTA